MLFDTTTIDGRAVNLASRASPRFSQLNSSTFRPWAHALNDFARGGDQSHVFQLAEVEPDLISSLIHAGVSSSLATQIISTRLRAHVALRFPSAIPSPTNELQSVVCHLGPTNSGKTHAALQFLIEQGRGCYAAPLRMLASEVYHRLCETLGAAAVGLRTGEEEINPEAPILCCTIEMAPTRGDTMVIDEVHWMVDQARGAYWTRVLLARGYAHYRLCGASEAEPLLRKMFAGFQDRFQVVHSIRRSTLHLATHPITSWSDPILKGETGEVTAVVCFSAAGVIEIASEIEKHNRVPVAVVYGAMPTTGRIEQLNRISTGEVKVLVTTDAIGHGLNLPIDRVVFAESRKYDGARMRPLKLWEGSQIAGRAGRNTQAGHLHWIEMRSRDTWQRSKLGTDFLCVDRSTMQRYAQVVNGGANDLQIDSVFVRPSLRELTDIGGSSLTGLTRGLQTWSTRVHAVSCTAYAEQAASVHMQLQLCARQCAKGQATPNRDSQEAVWLLRVATLPSDLASYIIQLSVVAGQEAWLTGVSIEHPLRRLQMLARVEHQALPVKSYWLLANLAVGEDDFLTFANAVLRRGSIIVPVLPTWDELLTSVTLKQLQDCVRRIETVAAVLNSFAGLVWASGHTTATLEALLKEASSLHSAALPHHMNNRGICSNECCEWPTNWHHQMCARCYGASGVCWMPPDANYANSGADCKAEQEPGAQSQDPTDGINLDSALSQSTADSAASASDQNCTSRTSASVLATCCDSVHQSETVMNQSGSSVQERRDASGDLVRAPTLAAHTQHCNHCQGQSGVCACEHGCQKPHSAECNSITNHTPRSTPKEAEGTLYTDQSTLRKELRLCTLDNCAYTFEEFVHACGVTVGTQRWGAAPELRCVDECAYSYQEFLAYYGQATDEHWSAAETAHHFATTSNATDERNHANVAVTVVDVRTWDDERYKKVSTDLLEAFDSIDIMHKQRRVLNVWSSSL